MSSAFTRSHVPTPPGLKSTSDVVVPRHFHHSAPVVHLRPDNCPENSFACMVVEVVEAYARFMSLGEEKTISVTTFRKSGDGVATPTWVVPLPDGRIGFWTSSKSGKVADGASPVTGTAQLVSGGAEFDEIRSKVKAKYGVMVPISKFFNTLGHIGNGPFPYGDTGVIISVDAYGTHDRAPLPDGSTNPPSRSLVMAHISTLDYAMEAPQRHVGQPFPSPTRTPRFLLRGQGAVKASVDGAWFPWTTNVTAELHDLISALSLRLGPIARVAFDWNTISSAQRRIDEVDGLEVRGPYPGQPHDLMYLDDIYGRQLVLMMIPPYTDPDRAYEVMRRLVDPVRSETYRVHLSGLMVLVTTISGAFPQVSAWARQLDSL
eukprot:gene25381-30469_t